MTGITSSIKCRGRFSTHLQCAVPVILSASGLEDRIGMGGAVSVTFCGQHVNPERLIVLVLTHLGFPGERVIKRVCCI